MYAAQWCMTLMLKVCSPHLHANGSGDVTKRRGGESKEAKGKQAKIRKMYLEMWCMIAHTTASGIL
jgi:hypothetical protein